jgi:glycosyltransferase involved in cell wall biosynthesis
MKITAIVLTYNEEIHLERCLESVKKITNKIIVVDSFSTDKTTKIAKKYGAVKLAHSWTNHSKQFNWALGKLDSLTKSDWILRLDADEYLTETLIKQIQQALKNPDLTTNGFYFNRRIIFQGKLIKYGGLSSNIVLRLFRYGTGKCENRWMDEHIKVVGLIQPLKGEIIDENLNSLTWWTDKHNKYASREAVDLLNLEFHFMPHDSIAELNISNSAALKRWFKEHVYSQLPSRFRAFMYFFYRYFIRLGFIDGKAGFSFHFLQGFWYRFLVDAKVTEVKSYMKNKNVDIKVAIEKVLGIKL